MDGSDFAAVTRAGRPESSQVADGKSARLVELAEFQVRADYRLAASKVPFDGALPPLIRPVQQLRRSTGSASLDSPRIESYHSTPRLLKPVALPDAQGFTLVGRPQLASNQPGPNSSLAVAEYSGSALWAMHSAVPGSARTVLTSMPRSHANLGLLDAIPPGTNKFAALLEEEPIAVAPLKPTPKLSFWSRVVGNILAIPVAGTVLAATVAAAPALAMLGTTCVMANAAIGAAHSIKSGLISVDSSSSTMSLSSQSSSKNPHAAKKKPATKKNKKKKSPQKKSSKGAKSTPKTPKGPLPDITQLQPTPHKAPVVRPPAGFTTRAVAAALALPTFCATLAGNAVLAGVHTTCSVSGAVCGTATTGAGMMRSLLVRWH